MKRNNWVEPKGDNKEEFVLDVSNRVVNSWIKLLEYWEMYVDVTGNLPDVVLMTREQFDWYSNELIAFSKAMGFDTGKNIKVNFRGLPIRKK